MTTLFLYWLWFAGHCTRTSSALSVEQFEEQFNPIQDVQAVKYLLSVIAKFKFAHLWCSRFTKLSSLQ